MKITKKQAVKIQETLGKVHTELDVIDDTLGYSYMEVYPGDGLAGNLKEVRNLLLRVGELLFD